MAFLVSEASYRIKSSWKKDFKRQVLSRTRLIDWHTRRWTYTLFWYEIILATNVKNLTSIPKMQLKKTTWLPDDTWRWGLWGHHWMILISEGRLTENLKTFMDSTIILQQESHYHLYTKHDSLQQQVQVYSPRLLTLFLKAAKDAPLESLYSIRYRAPQRETSAGSMQNVEEKKCHNLKVWLKMCISVSWQPLFKK